MIVLTTFQTKQQAFKVSMVDSTPPPHPQVNAVHLTRPLSPAYRKSMISEIAEVLKSFHMTTKIPDINHILYRPKLNTVKTRIDHKGTKFSLPLLPLKTFGGAIGVQIFDKLNNSHTALLDTGASVSCFPSTLLNQFTIVKTLDKMKLSTYTNKTITVVETQIIELFLAGYGYVSLTVNFVNDTKTLLLGLPFLTTTKSSLIRKDGNFFLSLPESGCHFSWKAKLAEEVSIPPSETIKRWVTRGW